MRRTLRSGVLLLGLVVQTACGTFLSFGSDDPAPPDVDAGAGESGDSPFADGGPEGDALANDAPDADALISPKRAFVTNKPYRMPQGPAGVMDAHCNEEAAAAGLGGMWLAWISDDLIDAKARFTTAGMDGPWFSLGPSRAQIAANRLMLSSGSIEAPINYPPVGTIPLDVFVWTGTLAGGMRSGSSCASWSDPASPPATTGSSTAVDAKWVSNAIVTPCGTTDGHIYCFEK